MRCGAELLNLFNRLDGKGTNVKIQVYTQLVKENWVVKNVLEYSSDPYRMYGMKGLDRSFPSEIEHCQWEAFFKALDIFTQKRGATGQDRAIIALLAGKCEYCREIVDRILKHKLRIGMGAKNLNKCGLFIPVAAVQLCEDDPRAFTAKSEFLCSPKLNGIRILFKKTNGVLSFLSRKGHVYPKLPEVFHDLDIPENIEFDGELTSPLGKDFAGGIARTIHKFKQPLEFIRQNLIINPFDMPSREGPLAERIVHLMQVPFTNDYVHIVLHKPHRSDSEKEFFQKVWGLMDFWVAKGYEGIVLKNPNIEYYPDRSNDWLKVKPFKTIDLPVLYAIEGTEGKTSGVLSALMCNFEGVEVKVGSGFDDDERVKYLIDPPKIIEVKYQSVTKDGSLEFPVFSSVREDLE